MRKLLGRLGRTIVAILPGAATLLLLFSSALCHAQKEGCTGAPDYDYSYPPTLTSMTPATWPAGQKTTVTIMGTHFCTSYFMISVPTGSVTESDDLSVNTDTEMQFTVTPDASDPDETATVTLGMIDIYECDGQCTNNSATAQIVNKCTAPTISSVTPLGWWAGKTKDITIKGKCFLTASEPNGPSQVTVTDGANAVTLSNVTVVDATRITASVTVSKTAPSEPAETATLTVTNPPNGIAPGSATANPAPVVLPVPVIKWRGNAISGPGTNNQSVKVGQPVELTTTPATLPGGFTVSKSTWIIPGTTIQHFSHPNSGIVLTPTETQKANTTFYWLYPPDTKDVVYTYCATDTNQNQICESPKAKAVFNVKSPGSLTLDTKDSLLASVQKLDGCSKVPGGPYLEYGDLYGPAPGCGADDGPPGINITASGASSGSYVFVQVVDADISQHTHAVGPSPTSCGAHAGLDGGYPFQDVKGQNHQIAYDGPQMPLHPNALTGTRTFHASLYLLWQPDQLSGAAASIPVPIGRQDWQFVATAIRNEKGKWEKHGTLTASGDESDGFVPSTPDDNAIYGYPQWTHLASNVCGVSQEAQ